VLAVSNGLDERLEPGGEPRYLVEPPSTCRDTLDRQGWPEPTLAVAVGPYHVGVRPGDPALAARLRAGLRAHTVAGLDPPANYSVRLAAPVRHRRGAGFHLLYRGCGLALRSRDPRRLVEGLVHHLDSFDPAYGAGCVALQAVALVRDGRALIAPMILRSSLARVERRLNLRGLRFVDTPCVLLDALRSEIVVPDTSLDVDWAAFDDLDTIAPGSRPDPPVPVGRYPVSGWTFLGDGNGISRARAVALATRATIRTRAAQPTLDALATVMRGIEPTSIRWAAPADLAAALAARS
jgi:hypothetical protein